MVWVLALLCAGISDGRQLEHDERLVGTKQHPRCFLCHSFPMGKTTRGAWPALKHHPRCPTAAVKQGNAALDSTKQTRKRHAASDPGESPEPASSQALTRRVVAPEPASTSMKQYNTRREEQIMRLLDETHARRIAAEEEGAAAAAAGEQGATHTGFTLAFVP